MKLEVTTRMEGFRRSSGKRAALKVEQGTFILRRVKLMGKAGNKRILEGNGFLPALLLFQVSASFIFHSWKKMKFEYINSKILASSSSL
jgi:hypothetical protein